MPPQALSSPDLTSRYHSSKLRLCRLCRRNPRLPLSQQAVQALSTLSSPAPASLSQREAQTLSSLSSKPSPPLSQRAVQALSALSSPALASHYHSGRLRLCHLCRSQLEAAQRIEINLEGLTSKMIIYWHEISWIHLLHRSHQHARKKILQTATDTQK